MALVVVAFYWGRKYSPDYVHKLAAGIARHLKQPHRFVVVRPERQDRPLTETPGCFCRLRLFDPAWQTRQGIAEGDRLVCLDLDMIITGPLDVLFDRAEDFVILQGANASNPCPYNGSVTMLRGGAHPEVWRDFSPEAAAKVPYFSFPDDQGWLWHTMPDAAGWTCGAASGIWAFGKRGWPKDNTLPAGARIVAFPGARDPSQFTQLDWVKEHWRV
jgi:hypothetical protein